MANNDSGFNAHGEYTDLHPGLNAGTQTATFLPTTGYIGPASFTYTVTDGQGGTASATVTIRVNLPTASLFSASEESSNVNFNRDAKPKRVVAMRRVTRQKFCASGEPRGSV